MQLAKFHCMDRWGDKTPAYLLNLPVLNELFPDAQFIHIVRDGRDVALSNLETPFGEKNLYLQALIWKENLSLIEKFFMHISRQRYAEIKYEELIADPVRVFWHLIQFLGIEDRDGRLINFIGDHITQDLNGDSVFKWKKVLRRKQVSTFEKLTADVLRKYDYEANNDKPWNPHSIIKLIWHLDSKVKKSLIRDYWSDNWHKMRLRIRGLILPIRKWTSRIGLSRHSPKQAVEVHLE